MTSSSPYSLAEVQKHNTVADCWMVISDKIYDLSNFFVETAPNADTEKCDGLDTVTAVSMNELTKRGSCPALNTPISHMGWSQSIKPGIAPNSTSYYGVWKANTAKNKARRNYAASLCGTDITDLFHGKVAFDVPNHTGANTASAKFRFNHTATVAAYKSTDCTENSAETAVCPTGHAGSEYPGLAATLLKRFYKADLVK